MKEVKIKSLGFTKDTLDSYNKTIINSITENISVKTRAKSNNIEIRHKANKLNSFVLAFFLLTFIFINNHS